jgi:hypothetical protein
MLVSFGPVLGPIQGGKRGDAGCARNVTRRNDRGWHGHLGVRFNRSLCRMERLRKDLDTGRNDQKTCESTIPSERLTAFSDETASSSTEPPPIARPERSR